MNNKKISALLLGILLMVACAPASGIVSKEELKNTISVNGVGTVSLTPDMATITVGVSTDNEDAKTAVSQNSKQVTNIMSALANLDIQEEDIKTVNFSVYPRQKYDDNGNVISVTYFVSNSVKVTVKDLDLLGELLNQVVGAGANTINSISFGLIDREGANQHAISLAMENALERATILAEASGSDLGSPQSISTYIGGGGEVYAEERSFSLAADSAVPISSGGLDIQVQVNVVYEID